MERTRLEEKGIGCHRGGRAIRRGCSSSGRGDGEDSFGRERYWMSQRFHNSLPRIYKAISLTFRSYVD